MKNGFDDLSNLLENLAKNLSDKEKRQLDQRLATKLRQQMKKRLRSQRDPSGAKFIPRKRSQSGRIRHASMFRKLGRLIKTAYSSNHAEVGFKGLTASIVETHQYGLTAKPSKFQDAVRYPVRAVVGFSDEDIKLIRNEIEKFMIGE